MMHVACGRLDAYFEDGFGGPWDVAAGLVIVEEVNIYISNHYSHPGPGQLVGWGCLLRRRRSFHLAGG